MHDAATPTSPTRCSARAHSTCCSLPGRSSRSTAWTRNRPWPGSNVGWLVSGDSSGSTSAGWACRTGDHHRLPRPMNNGSKTPWPCSTRWAPSRRPSLPRTCRAPEGIALAAAMPERVSSLVVVNGAAVSNRHPTIRTAPTRPFSTHCGNRSNPMPSTRELDLLAMIAPSVGGDPAFRAWFDRAGNLGATPAMAHAHWATVFTNRCSRPPPRIQVPTLILHRTDVAAVFLNVGHGRYLADHIPKREVRRVARGWTPSTGWATPDRCSTRSRSS